MIGAAGAAGVAALRPIPAFAAGSPYSVVMLNPARVVDTRSGGGPLLAGHDYVFGPFPVGEFTSEFYSGIVANLTATAWTGSGWLSARPSDMVLVDPEFSNLDFGGPGLGVGNLAIVRLGALPPPTGDGSGAQRLSDGTFKVHVGAPEPGGSTHLAIDVFGYMLPVRP